MNRPNSDARTEASGAGLPPAGDRPVEAADACRSPWRVGDGFDEIPATIGAPEHALELLEKLGPSPFERGGFPLIGFLATTYDKVSRFATEQGPDSSGR